MRYWAGARAAAGTPEDSYDVTGDLTLAELVALVLERHPGERMARTVAVCSVLVGDRPVRSQDPETVRVEPGSVVELSRRSRAAEHRARADGPGCLDCRGRGHDAPVRSPMTSHGGRAGRRRESATVRANPCSDDNDKGESACTMAQPGRVRAVLSAVAAGALAAAALAAGRHRRPTPHPWGSPRPSPTPPATRSRASSPPTSAAATAPTSRRRPVPLRRRDEPPAGAGHLQVRVRECRRHRRRASSTPTRSTWPPPTPSPSPARPRSRPSSWRRPDRHRPVVNTAGRPVRSAGPPLHRRRFVSSAPIERDGTFRIGASSPAPTSSGRRRRLRLRVLLQQDHARDRRPDHARRSAAGARRHRRQPRWRADRPAEHAGTGLERVRGVPPHRLGGSSCTDHTDANGVFRIEGAPRVYKIRFTDPVGEFLGEWFNDKADQAVRATELVSTATRPSPASTPPSPTTRPLPSTRRP